MNYLHYPLRLHREELVEVDLDGQANVQLLDDANYAKYRRGERFQYFGGLARTSPVRLAAPQAGSWHLIIDLGGYAGTVQASVRTMSGAA